MGLTVYDNNDDDNYDIIIIIIIIILFLSFYCNNEICFTESHNTKQITFLLPSS
jgi:hypothetical protein